jgi:hypothetical protein
MAVAAETSIKPFIAVSEEITDNFFELPSGTRTELITSIKPGAAYLYKSPFWTWDSAYNFEYRNFARGSKGDEYNHNVAIKGNIALLENFLFLDLNDTFHRISLDTTRDTPTVSSQFLNQTDQNIAVISPYLFWRLRGDSTLKTGYSFTDIRYWDSFGIEKQEHRAFADLNHEITKKLNISAGYAFTRLESLPSKYNKHDLSSGFRYEYADKSFVSGQIGNSWQLFDNGIDANYLFWNAGITHDFDHLVATFDTRVSSTEDPLTVSLKEISYSGRLEKKLQRGMVGISSSYSEFINTETDKRDHRMATIGATGRYELDQDLNVNLTLTGERFSRKTAADYPYRVSTVLGLNFLFNHEITLGMTYSYITNRYDLDSASGSKDINKLLVEVKKAF